MQRRAGGSVRLAGDAVDAEAEDRARDEQAPEGDRARREVLAIGADGDERRSQRATVVRPASSAGKTDRNM